jgi:hypothetical protein
MCLLCEELWMPFELPPEAKPRTFVADSPEHRPLGSPPLIRAANRGEGSGVGGASLSSPTGSLRSPPSPPLASLARGGKEQASPPASDPQDRNG